MSELRDTMEKTIAAAEERGCEIVYPADNELFIDIDSYEDLCVFEKQIEILKEGFIAFVDRTPSPSGEAHHFHIRVRLMGLDASTVVLTEEMRIALQAALGSDRVRELLSCRRLLDGVRARATLFFEKKS